MDEDAALQWYDSLFSNRRNGGEDDKLEENDGTDEDEWETMDEDEDEENDEDDWQTIVDEEDE